MNKKHFDISIRGKVQGVGFRFETKQKADELGLRGYARNMRDGSVSVEVEGDESIIEEFIKWFKSNPGISLVDEINKTEGELKWYRDFTVY